MNKDFELLLNKARELANIVYLNDYVTYGHVACAILSDSSEVYTGLCVNSKCSLGSCAEQAAILEMLKHHEHIIKKLVVYSYKGCVYVPCGKCREFMKMLGMDNMNAQILMPDYSVLRLAALLPFPFARCKV